jgi:hypothetical protein
MYTIVPTHVYVHICTYVCIKNSPQPTCPQKVRSYTCTLLYLHMYTCFQVLSRRHFRPWLFGINSWRRRYLLTWYVPKNPAIWYVPNYPALNQGWNKVSVFRNLHDICSKLALRLNFKCSNVEHPNVKCRTNER